jgi:hypothetical protein
VEWHIPVSRVSRAITGNTPKFNVHLNALKLNHAQFSAEEEAKHGLEIELVCLRAELTVKNQIFDKMGLESQ